MLVMISSCKQETPKSLVTKKIQYDVSIISPNSSYDPWIQNIEETPRLKLVSNFLTAAYEGRVTAYDYFNKPLSIEEIKSIGVDTIYRTLTRDYPPYAEYDTIIVSKIELTDIVKIRFLEEWYLDEQNMVFEKVVMGIAPVINKYDNEGNLIGPQPMFWIYKEGIEAMKNE
jgi:hypothetical protein